MIFIPGAPAPQGSSRAFVRGNRAIITHANAKTMPWRDTVRSFVGVGLPGIVFPEGPVAVTARFVMPRVKSEPKRSTRPHTRKPDLDKLVRAVLDALTGVVFTDDSQVTAVFASKRTAEIGEKPGLWLGYGEGSDSDADSCPRCQRQSDENPHPWTITPEGSHRGSNH